jgi:hypothetical protein
MDTAQLDAEKTYQTLRARAARQGLMVFRTDPRDGIVTFITVAGHGMARRFIDLTALASRIDDLEAGEA